MSRWWWMIPEREFYSFEENFARCHGTSSEPTNPQNLFFKLFKQFHTISSTVPWVRSGLECHGCLSARKNLPYNITRTEQKIEISTPLGSRARKKIAISSKIERFPHSLVVKPQFFETISINSTISTLPTISLNSLLNFLLARAFSKIPEFLSTAHKLHYCSLN